MEVIKLHYHIRNLEIKSDHSFLGNSSCFTLWEHHVSGIFFCMYIFLVQLLVSLPNCKAKERLSLKGDKRSYYWETRGEKNLVHHKFVTTFRNKSCECKYRVKSCIAVRGRKEGSVLKLTDPTHPFPCVGQVCAQQWWCSRRRRQDERQTGPR